MPVIGKFHLNPAILVTPSVRCAAPIYRTHVYRERTTKDIKERPMQEDLVVRRETRITAPPAAVFALLTDPENILRWMGTEAQVEPEPGGLYLVNVTGARFARGAFREVVPVHRLAYSFGWDGSKEVPPGSSLVEIDLIEQPGGTLLRLTHTGLPNAEQCAGHAEGWAHYIGRLAEVAAGRDPGPDPWHGRTGRE
jgi:uncharacterized protein YndB with AHSA1/START domain